MDETILFYAKLLMPQVPEDKIIEYLLFVDSLPVRERSNRFYTELHHIIPCFLCKSRSFLVRIPQNMKILSVSDHILAHKKLMEIFPCLQTKTAYLMILRTCKKLGIAITEEAESEEIPTREWLRENTPWKHGPSPEQKEKSRLARLGKHIGKGSRLYHKGDIEIRASTEKEWSMLEQEGWTHGRSPRIKKLAEERLREISKAFKGTSLMEKDGIHKRVSAEEGVILRSQGWIYARAPKVSRKGTTYVTNGTKTISITQQELQEYLNKGWRQGLTRKNKVTVENYTLPFL
jgi:hypothetical protein